ncbi:YuiA family protein [Alkalihalobacillus sp. R86527]
MRRQQRKVKATDCPYCKGKGYFQLLLGGSETCDNCGGSGAKQNPTTS